MFLLWNSELFFWPIKVSGEGLNDFFINIFLFYCVTLIGVQYSCTIMY